MNPSDRDHPFVSRGGLKLAAALDHFQLDPAGFTCADFGSNVGGFVDCLLQRAAAKVYAIDSGYGALAWKLRTDPRVVVLERTNALHLDPPEKPIDLITIDLAWTRQHHAIPAALRWQPRHIITLIKPHYEAPPARGKPILTDDDALAVHQRVLEHMPSLGVRVIDSIQSPVRGGAGKKHAGNLEFLALLAPAPASPPTNP